MSLPIPESLRRKIQGVRICSQCDSDYCGEIKRLSEKRYREPVTGECSYCKAKDVGLMWCNCDLTPCPDGCGCPMQVHVYGSKTRTLWCSKPKCWGFRHKTELKPQETQIQADKREVPEMLYDAIEPDNLPEDYKLKAAGE